MTQCDLYSLIVFTRKPDGEIVHWELGHKWTEFVMAGATHLPSPAGHMEPIVVIEYPLPDGPTNGGRLCR